MFWLTGDVFTGSQNRQARESDRRLKPGTRQAHRRCWAQTLQVPLLTLSSETRVPPSGSPAASESPTALQSPAHNELASCQFHTSLSSALNLLCLHLISGIRATCLLSGYKGDREGGFLASSLRMGRHAPQCKGLSEGSGRP